jgi:hypothetical protein
VFLQIGKPDNALVKLASPPVRDVSGCGCVADVQDVEREELYRLCVVVPKNWTLNQGKMPCPVKETTNEKTSFIQA